MACEDGDGQATPVTLSDDDWVEIAYSAGEVLDDQRLVDSGYRLTPEHWGEIFRALCHKLERVGAGDYDDHPHDPVCREWSAHLAEIITKIGADGSLAAARHVILPRVARDELGGVR
jgi:hypothetical protein